MDFAAAAAAVAPTAVASETLTVNATGTVTVTTVENTKVSIDTVTVAGVEKTYVEGKEADADGVKAAKAWNAKVDAYETAKAAYDATLKASTDAKAAYDALAADLKLGSVAAYDAAIEAAKAASKGTYVGVEVKSTTPTAETLFTKFESNKVGLKSGITVDGGVVKTVSADLGAWKPDALRQIRDAIADNSGVTLTFTAKDNFDDAAYRAWAKSVGGANLNWTATNGVWDTDNTKDSYDPWGVSMFTGAIVLNRDFSKQFSASGLVDWGTNTITFDWDELTEGRFYDASVVLHSVELLSTQNVEWVSCTVTVPEQEAASDSADSSQGKTEDPDEIETTPVETEVITEAPVETEAPATEAPAETTAVAPVENIPTGNAPVALAVIPVALAAAAVIAKKRG